MMHAKIRKQKVNVSKSKVPVIVFGRARNDFGCPYRVRIEK